MRIVHDMGTSHTEYAEAELDQEKGKWYKQVQILLLARSITVQHISDEEGEFYLFAGFLGKEEPTKENTYGYLAILGATDRNKRKVFEWNDGQLASNDDTKKAIYASCKALMEMETEGINYVKNTGEIGKLFYKLDQTPETRVLQIFKDVFSQKK